MSDLSLPAVTSQTVPVLASLTTALRVPREILASDDEIQRVWGELPRLLSRIPAEMLTPNHARMCVAVAAGLFDSAINYAWNSAVLALRDRVRAFGLNVVTQINSKNFDERTLVELKDADLLSLCLSLNLITEDGYFFLDQCRNTRNNFSSAHPAVGPVDDDEFIAFLSRCAKYALTSTRNPRGVDAASFMIAVKGARFTTEQSSEWVERLTQTHEAQRSLLYTTLHGLYCDPSSSQETRLNALDICVALVAEITPVTKSELISRHSEYIAQGKTDRQSASQDFLKRIGLLSILTEPERHALISTACKDLMSVHMAYDNFYNEPPFANRLYDVAKQGAVPQTAQYEYVETVVSCAIGNGYGVSNAAYPAYEKMIRSFSPREIHLLFEMLSAPTSQLSRKTQNYTRCKHGMKAVIKLLDPKSIPTRNTQEYQQWIN